MRLNRCVQVAVGLVAGGSVLMVLSGSALAASNSQDTVIQNGKARTYAQGSNQQTSAPSDGTVSQSNAGGGNPDSTTTSGQSAGTVGSADNGSGQQSDPADSTNAQTGSQVSQTSSISSAQAAPAPVKSKGGGNGTGAGVVSSISVPAAPTGAATDAGAGQTEVAVVTAGESNAVPAVHRTLLPIQPVITNRSTEAQDLAAAVPSAPAPARAPNPAKSSGLLGALVVGLAGVVVPQPLTPHAGIVQRVVLAVSVSTLVVLLLNVFFFSYGLWLRRGGFATAARSDAPEAGTSSFATPLLLGYVTSPPDLHNPILMVADTNTSNRFVRTAFRKEVMR